MVLWSTRKKLKRVTRKLLLLGQHSLVHYCLNGVVFEIVTIPRFRKCGNPIATKIIDEKLRDMASTLMIAPTLAPLLPLGLTSNLQKTSTMIFLLEFGQLWSNLIILGNFSFGTFYSPTLVFTTIVPHTIVSHTNTHNQML